MGSVVDLRTFIFRVNLSVPPSSQSSSFFVHFFATFVNYYFEVWLTGTQKLLVYSHLPFSKGDRKSTSVWLLAKVCKRNRPVDVYFTLNNQQKERRFASLCHTTGFNACSIFFVYRTTMMNYFQWRRRRLVRSEKWWNRWATTTCLETRATYLVIFQANPKELKRRSPLLLFLGTTYSPRMQLLQVCRAVLFLVCFLCHCFPDVLRNGANCDFIFLFNFYCDYITKNYIQYYKIIIIVITTLINILVHNVVGKTRRELTSHTS